MFSNSYSFTLKTGEAESLYASSFLSRHIFCRPVDSLSKFLDGQKSEKNTFLKYLFLSKLEKFHSTEMLDSKTYNHFFPSVNV